MAVLPILITGDPVLHSPAEPVTRFDATLVRLVDDMIETMHDAPGVGLAAPQVGVGLRVFVYHWTDDDLVVHSGVAINPELWLSPIPLGEADEDEESEGMPLTARRALPPPQSGSRDSQGRRPRPEAVRGARRGLARADLPARVRPSRWHPVCRSARAELPQAVAKVTKKQGWAFLGCRGCPGSTTSRTSLRFVALLR